MVEENTLHTKNKEDLANEYIYVKADSKQKFTKINLKDILFIGGYGNYQKLQTIERQVVSQLKLKDLEEQLTPFGFMRVHNSFLIAIEKIEIFDKKNIYVQNHEIAIRESYKEVVFKNWGKRC